MLLLTGCFATTRQSPVSEGLTPFTGNWAKFVVAEDNSTSWIGSGKRQQSFDPASLEELRRDAAALAKADVSKATVSGCAAKNTVVTFHQEIGGRDVANAGVSLNFSANRQLSYFRTYVVASPEQVTPPVVPADSRQFVINAIVDRVPDVDRASLMIELSEPFLYAVRTRAVWVVRATLAGRRREGRLPFSADAIIDLVTRKRVSFFDHIHSQNQPDANLLLPTPLQRCTHDEYLTVSTSPTYSTDKLKHLTANAVTPTGDYATPVDLDPSIANAVWTCVSHGVCDFHFTWNHDKQKFGEVMAYYHITAVQDHVQKLGFTTLANRPIQFDVLAQLGDDIAVYNNNASGTGTLWFGDDSGHNSASDGKVIVHEYGHAIQAAALHQRMDMDTEPSAISEGFADYLAMSTFAGRETDQCRLCFGIFMHGGYCYRKYDDPQEPVPNYDPATNPNEAHALGMIWMHALWLTLDSVRTGLSSKSWDDARDIVDRGVLLGHCYLGPDDTAKLDMRVAALATLAAVKDDTVTSPYFDQFCSGFTTKHILAADDCTSIQHPSVPLE